MRMDANNDANEITCALKFPIGILLQLLLLFSGVDVDTWTSSRLVLRYFPHFDGPP